MSCLTSGFDECIQQAATGTIARLAQEMADGAGYAIKTYLTVWTDLPSLGVAGEGSAATWLNERLTVFVFAAAFCSVLVGAFRLARTGQFEHVTELGLSLAKLVAVAGLGATVVTLGLQIGDLWSTYILGQVDFSPGSLALLVVPTIGVPGSQLAVLVIGFVIFGAQLVQLVLMVAKAAICVLVTAFLPISAAATNTSIGSSLFVKSVGWLFAWVLYKGVAVTIYALAFKLASADQGITAQMSGVALMVLAIVALPAMIKIAVPAVSAASSGNAGAISVAAVGAGIATGVVIAGGMATGGGGLVGLAGGPSGSPASPSGSALSSLPAAAVGSGLPSGRDTSPVSDESEAA